MAKKVLKKARAKTTAVAVAVIPPVPVSFFNWPGTIDRICARIGAGGTLVDFCNEFNQRFKDVYAWIEENDDRRKRYFDALKIREIHWREQVLRDINQLRDLDIFTLHYETGALKPLSEIPEAARRWIARLETMDYYEGAGNHRIKIGELKKVWYYDKLKAIEMLTKVLSMIDDKKKPEGVRTLEDILAESRQEGDVVQVEQVTATRVTIGARQ